MSHYESGLLMHIVVDGYEKKRNILNENRDVYTLHQTWRQTNRHNSAFPSSQINSCFKCFGRRGETSDRVRSSISVLRNLWENKK